MSKPQPRIFSIKEITRYIKGKLEGDALLSDVWLRGEISNYTHHASGHMYFTLKDKDSRLKCIMFASHNQRLAFLPKEGMRVLARGNFSVYERDGNYQFYVTTMQPDGIGSLYLAYEQLKRRLEAEGLFAQERKRPLPAFPRSIAIITSPSGAAVRDMLTTLGRRMPSVHVYVVPVLVQGNGAAPAIARAIEAVNRWGGAELLIIGRGGGSLEELWAFNEEQVARAIAASSLPVISAVGHETDFTIADFVADLRAATPTAAAELAVPHREELRARIARQREQLRQLLQARLLRSAERLRLVQRSPVLLYPKRALLQPAQRLDRLRERLQQATRQLGRAHRERLTRAESLLQRAHPGARMRTARQQVQQTDRQLHAAMQRLLQGRRLALGGALRGLDALSPLKVMARGYSLVYDEKHEKLIKSITAVQPGDLVKVRLRDGELDCQVWAMREESGHE